VVVVSARQNPLLTSNRTVVATLTIDGTYRVPPAAAAATVTILNSAPPAIAAQPQNQMVNLGSNASFSVSATGTAPLVYQWLFNATNAVAGGINSLLVLTNVQDLDAGGYSVLVSNAAGAVLSSTAVLSVNHSPQPASPRWERYPEASLKVRSAALLGSDPDGDSLFLSAVSPTSLHGATVSTNSIPGWVYYQPPAGLTNEDSFGYTVGDGRDGFGAGTVTVALVSNTAPALTLAWEDLGNGTVRLAGDGVPTLEYFVEFAEVLEAATWQRLGTVVPDQFGQFTFVDNQMTNVPTRFYRLFRSTP
jgi:hypothetical protein